MENKKDKNHEDFMDRRDMLKRMLKYSSIAAVVLAGPMTLLESGCGGGGSTPDPPGPTPGSTPESAIAINRGGQFSSVNLAPGSSIRYYCFDRAGSTTMDLVVDILSLTPATAGFSLRLLSASLAELGSIWVSQTGIIDSDGTDIASGQYLAFDSGATNVTFGFKLVDSLLPAWSNWNDYSDWEDGYSEWIDGYTEWNDAYSEYSEYTEWNDWNDHWSDWYNAPWGNWMQSW